VTFGVAEQLGLLFLPTLPQVQLVCSVVVVTFPETETVVLQ
jgi:hypothetical protein